jgi:hypothetical protein
LPHARLSAAEARRRAPGRGGAGGGARAAPPAAAHPPPTAVQRRQYRAGENMVERELVRVLLHFRNYVDSIAERLGDSSFRDARYRQILKALMTHGSDASLDRLAEALDPEALAELEALAGERGGLDDPESVVHGGAARLQARLVQVRHDEIDREFALTDLPEEKDRLIREKKRLHADLQALGVYRYKAFGSPRR